MSVTKYTEENENELVVRFREAMFEEAKKNPDSYCQEEIMGLKDDFLCVRFLSRHESLERAIIVAKACYKWREEYGIRHITYNSIDPDIVKLNFISVFGKDKVGCLNTIFIGNRIDFRAVDKAEVLRYMAYVSEHNAIQGGKAKRNIILCATGCGLHNADLEFFRFLIALTRDAYGHYGGCFLVYDMPWILQTIFKAVKVFLVKADLARLKFVDKDSIKEFIDDSELPDFMGGSATEADYMKPFLKNA